MVSDSNKVTTKRIIKHPGRFLKHKAASGLAGHRVGCETDAQFRRLSGGNADCDIMKIVLGHGCEGTDHAG
jgi:hypothetical protein